MMRFWKSASGTISARLLFGVVALVPLPFGSNDPSTIAFWCLLLGASLALAPTHSLRSSHLKLVGFGSVIVAAYCFVLHEQLATPFWHTAPPEPIWQDAAQSLGVPIAPSVSIARNEPWFELGRVLICALAIACGFLVGVEPVRARRLIKVIAWSGAAYAGYGIVAHLIDPTQLLWQDKVAYLSSVTGTFVNRNTAGAYFGSCAVVWLLLISERLRRNVPKGLKNWRELRGLSSYSASKGTITFFAMLFLCLAAMFMTGSRAAVIISLVALLLAVTLFFRRKLQFYIPFGVVIFGGAAAMLILLQLMGGIVNSRFDIDGASSGGRLEVYKSILRLIVDHPWLGTGQGTFIYAFPAYRNSDVSMFGVWDIGHNTLLELAADMGVPIALLVVASWIVMFRVLLHGTRVRRRELIIPVAALTVGALAVTHSLVDFSLQIPGYSVVALSLVGAGLAQSLRARSDESDIT